MNMVDIILKKKAGEALSAEEIRFFAQGAAAGTIPDYQLSALLMAICWRGMNAQETTCLTMEMMHSGGVVDLSAIDGVCVDKHSTGGVGDKTSLAVVPLLAAMDPGHVFVAKMSGRGLGHTGGTLDKLESIPGLSTQVERDDFLRIVREHGGAIISQTGNLVPADKLIYALRDVTATVGSIPLIASSIMSKKLADGSDCILLDVKTGSGSFMKTIDDSRLLARTMVDIGRGAGVRTAALITNMDSPLGSAVGNSLEVIESVEILKGKTSGDLWTVCRELSCRMLMLAGIGDKDECGRLVDEAVESGEALKRFEMMVKLQGGDVSYIEDTSKFRKASFSREVYAPADGYITHMDSEKIGLTAVLLGAGREKKDDDINHAAGIIIAAKTGDFVKRGELLATLFADDESRLDGAESRYLFAVSIGDKKPAEQPMILDYID